MKEKVKIFKYIMEKFLTQGIKNITMDEIARELKISKKTIYKYFSSKDVIMELVFKIITTRISSEFRRIQQAETNAVIKFSKITQFFLQNAGKLSEGNLRYLKFQNPGLWEKIDNFRTKIIVNNFYYILEQGKKEGLIKDFPTSLMLQIYSSTIRNVINPDFLINNSISSKEAGEATIYILFRGILTETGWKIFEEYKKEIIR